MRCFLAMGLLPFTVASLPALLLRFGVGPAVAAVGRLPAFPAFWGLLDTAATIWGSAPVAGLSFFDLSSVLEHRL